MASPGFANILDLYQRILSAGVLEYLQKQTGMKIRRGVYSAQVVLWLIVLLTGHYPRWGYGLVGGYIRWATRIMAFMFGLTDRYPPFRLKN